MKIEYQVRPVTRYIVTRYEEDGNAAASSSFGEFDNERKAHEVCFALGNSERVSLGWDGEDPRISYPRRNPEHLKSLDDWLAEGQVMPAESPGNTASREHDMVFRDPAWREAQAKRSKPTVQYDIPGTPMPASEALRIARKTLAETFNLEHDKRKRQMAETSQEAIAYNLLAAIHPTIDKTYPVEGAK